MAEQIGHEQSCDDSSVHVGQFPSLTFDFIVAVLLFLQPMTAKAIGMGWMG